MRGSQREELLEVRDHTTGTRYEIGKPGRRSAGSAGLVSLVITAVIGFALAKSGLDGGVVVIVCILAFVGSWLLFAKLMAPTHQLAPVEEQTLTASQQLLATKRELVELQAGAHAEMQQRVALRSRLTGLRAKMQGVGLEAYRPRIELIERAVRTLDEQIAVDRRLQEEYGKSIAIIEIEHESGVAADAASDDASLAVEGKLAELAMLREQQAELERQLAANAEVEALVRGTA